MQTQTLTQTDIRTDEPDVQTDVLAGVPPQSRPAHHPETEDEPQEPPEIEEPPAGEVSEAPEPAEPLRGRADTSGPSSDLFRQYLREIGRIPLLTAAEEVELARSVEAGLFAEEKLGNTPDLDTELPWTSTGSWSWPGRQAQAHRGQPEVVVSVAKRYVGRGLTMLDSSRRATSA